MRLMSVSESFLPIFAETIRLNGRLNHIISLFLFLVLFATADVFCCFWNVILCSNPLLTNAFLYKSLDLLQAVSSADQLLILLDILPGRFLIIFGEWLASMLIYNGILSGLLQGWYLPVVRFRVTPRNLTAFKFVSQVILRSKSYLKIFIKFFLILLAWSPLIYPKQANPSSWYKPILCFPYISPKMWRIYKPTSLHSSAPSKLPIVTSKSGSPFFFIHISVLLNSRDFLECIMVLISSSLIFTKAFAYVIALKLKNKILQYHIA